MLFFLSLFVITVFSLHIDALQRGQMPVNVPSKFTKDFTKPMSIPEEGIQAAVEVMRSGRLFRYSATSAETSQVAQAEKAFAEKMGFKYAVGVNSCSSAILLALKAAGVKAGDRVATNGFTFTALPSTIMRLEAEPVLIEASMDWTMDLDDLEIKLEKFKPKVLLLSHMRGKLCDLNRAKALCEKHNTIMIEDCAHGCGVKWEGRQVGYHGVMAAYSTQSDKVINSGEGGFITTDDPKYAAQILYLSGCYERRYGKHLVKPDDELCEAAMMTMPNLSCRMSEITASCITPLIKNLDDRIVDYNRRYDSVIKILEEEAGDLICVPKQDPRVFAVGDHLNFFLKDVTDAQNKKFMQVSRDFGVPLSGFTSEVNARWHQNWRKFGAPTFDLPKTDKLLSHAYDQKMPPYFEDQDFLDFAKVIAYAARVSVVDEVVQQNKTALSV